MGVVRIAPPPARPRSSTSPRSPSWRRVFVVAAPAVGAPDIPRARRRASCGSAICLVGERRLLGPGGARTPGLAPCPLQSDMTGREVSVDAFSIEVGARWTLTVTPQSDGTVAWSRTRERQRRRRRAALGAGLALGPVAFDVGASAAARARVAGGARLGVPRPGDGRRGSSSTRCVNSVDERGDFPPPGTRSKAARELRRWSAPRSARRAPRTVAQLVGVGRVGRRRARRADRARRRRDALRPRSARRPRCRCRSCRRRSGTGARSGSSSTRSAATGRARSRSARVDAGERGNRVDRDA